MNTHRNNRNYQVHYNRIIVYNNYNKINYISNVNRHRINKFRFECLKHFKFNSSFQKKKKNQLI